MNFALSGPTFGAVLPPTLPVGAPGDNSPQRIKQVSIAMEQMFAGQLMAELGKGIDGTDNAEGGQYSDFIQQAMAQGVTQGGGLGLAKMIEQSMTKHAPGKLPMETPVDATKKKLEITTVHHAHHAI